MLHSIVSLNDIFYEPQNIINSTNTSTNPYDYIRWGYFIDNAALYGGKNYVNFNGNLSGNRTSNSLDYSDI